MTDAPRPVYMPVLDRDGWQRCVYRPEVYREAQSDWPTIGEGDRWLIWLVSLAQARGLTAWFRHDRKEGHGKVLITDPLGHVVKFDVPPLPPHLPDIDAMPEVIIQSGELAP